MSLKKKFVIILLLSGIFYVPACKKSYIPKPHGYIRTDFPTKEYQLFDTTFPYVFEYPTYSKITPDKSEGAEKYWANWVFPDFNATVYLSYKNIENNLIDLEEDTRKFAYKHSIKADAIEPVIWNNETHRVYGILYDIKGDVASQIQFYLTDSTKHFIRGAFYFNLKPNKDSLAPSLEFLRQDVNKMIESFKWKEN